jgi:predicted GNAT family acetyltransferase
MEFRLEKNRISLKLEDGQEAFITFGVEKEKKVLVVSTTYVPENHRGKGLAGKLSQKLVEFADENGYKIYPLCSYTQKFLMRKRPDLIAEAE